jgi:Spy/CpxP family protein refolding chaperone
MKRIAGWAAVVAVVLMAGVTLAQEQRPQGQPQPQGGGPRFEGQAGRVGGPTPNSDMDRMGFLLERLAEGPELAEKLGLSEDQRQKLRNSLFEMKNRQVELRAEMEKASLAQAKLLTEKTVDETAVMAAVEKTGAIHTEMAKLRIKGVLLLKQTLTPEQQDKARQMLREHFKNRPNRPPESGDREAMKKRWEKRQGERGREGGERPPPPPPPAAHEGEDGPDRE